MKKSGLSYNSFLAALAGCVLLATTLPSAMGQPYSFFVQLTGAGAPLGRLLVLDGQDQDLTAQGECLFQLSTNTGNFNFTPLQPDQLSCVFPGLAPRTQVRVFALDQALWITSGTVSWEVAFGEFSGACKGQGTLPVGGPDYAVHECEFFMSGDTALQVGFNTILGGPAPTPTAEPTPLPTSAPTAGPDPETVMGDFINTSLDNMGDTLQNLGLDKLLGDGSVKLIFPPAPEGGVVKLILTARVKKIRAAGARVTARGLMNMKLGAGKVILSTTTATKMRFAFTKPAKKYLAGKKQVKAVAQATWIPPGTVSSALSRLQNLTLRRKK
jgi:hypothetical protein